MKKNNLKVVYTLFFLYFVCCMINASQGNERSIRARAIAWKKSKGYTQESFAFCTEQEKKDQIQKKQEKQEFRALFTDSKPIPIKNKSNKIINPIQKIIPKTPLLHKTFKKNNTKLIIKLLQEVPISIHKKQDHNGDTLVHIACKNNNIEIIKLLYRYFDSIIFTIKNNQGYTPLHIVCMHNYIELLQIFCNTHRHYVLDLAINLKTKAGLTPLNLACVQKNTDVVKLLLSKRDIQKDVNINIGDIDNSTPLHHAVENGTIDIITLLLNHNKIDPNTQDTITTYKEIIIHQNIFSEEKCIKGSSSNVNNNTPLHIACYKNNAEAVRLLLQHKYTNPTIKNKDQLTPLQIATINKNDEIISLLHNHSYIEAQDSCIHQ